MNKEQKLQNKLDNIKGWFIIMLIVALITVTVVSCNYPVHNKLPDKIVIPYLKVEVDGHSYFNYSDTIIRHMSDCSKCKDDK